MVEEEIITLPEVKEILLKEEEVEGEAMRYEKRKALEHATLFSKISAENARKMMTELMDIERMTPAYAAKFAEIAPQHPDDIRAIFSRERFEISEEDVQRIIDIIKKYIE